MTPDNKHSSGLIYRAHDGATMKTIKVVEATNLQLDWLVWKCAGGIDAYPKTGSGKAFLKLWNGNTAKYVHPTADPAQMHPIIEREGISTVSQGDAHEWIASLWNYNTQDWHMHKTGATPLIAAARCYVVSKLGEEVEVPEELT